MHYVPKVKLEIAVDDSLADRVVETIGDSARTVRASPDRRSPQHRSFELRDVVFPAALQFCSHRSAELFFMTIRQRALLFIHQVALG